MGIYTIYARWPGFAIELPLLYKKDITFIYVKQLIATPDQEAATLLGS